MIMLSIGTWGGNAPECGIPTVEFREKIVASDGYSDDGKVLTLPMTTNLPKGTPFAAVARMLSCSIVISRMFWDDYYPVEKCDLIEHEMGHFKLPGGDPYHQVDAMRYGHKFRDCRKWLRSRRKSAKHRRAIERYDVAIH